MQENNIQSNTSDIVNKLLNYYTTQKRFEQDVGDYLQSKTASPKLYSNDLRHQYASAITAQQLGQKPAEILGDLNEFFDFNASGRDDTAIDKYNNNTGRQYAIKYPDYTKEQFLDELFNNAYAIKQQRVKEIGY